MVPVLTVMVTVLTVMVTVLWLQGHRLEQVMTKGFVLELLCTVPMLITVSISASLFGGVRGGGNGMFVK